jgi:GH24 family phage-related lysozyme (muramidase)
MLTEIAFNTGTLIENGVYNWPTLTKAIHDKDYGVASSQLNRTYTRKDGKQISLRGRTNALKAVYKTLLKDAGWTKDNSQASVDKTDYKNMIT